MKIKPVTKDPCVTPIMYNDDDNDKWFEDINGPIRSHKSKDSQ